MMDLFGQKPTAECGYSFSMSQYNWMWLHVVLEAECLDAVPTMCGWDHLDDDDPDSTKMEPHEIHWDSSGCLVDAEHANGMAAKILEWLDNPDPDRKPLRDPYGDPEPAHLERKLRAFAEFAGASGGFKML